MMAGWHLRIPDAGKEGDNNGEGYCLIQCKHLVGHCVIQDGGLMVQFRRAVLASGTMEWDNIRGCWGRQMDGPLASLLAGVACCGCVGQDAGLDRPLVVLCSSYSP